MNTKAKFYSKCIEHFIQFRHSCEGNIGRYISRLSTTLDIVKLEELQNDEDPTNKGVKTHSVLSTIARLFTSIFKALGYAFKRPMAHKQLKKLGTLDDLLIVCLATNRIPINPRDKNIRSYLADLLRNFTSPTQTKFADKVRSDELIVVVDVSEQIWSPADIDLLMQENILVLNDAHLFGNLLRAGAARPSLLFGLMGSIFAILSRRAFGRDNKSVPLLQSLAFHMLAPAIDCAFQSASNLSLVMTTSISVLSDALRFNIMGRENSNMVCEISHGINHGLVDNFVGGICAAEQEYIGRKQHVFIEQIPHLPKFGMKANREFGNKNFAINVYINRFLAQYDFNPDILQNELLSSAENMQRERGLDEALIVNFLGFADPTYDLTSHLSFQVEICLMNRIITQAREMNIPLLLVYSAHPVVNPDELRQQDIFRDNNIEIIQSAMKMHFTADLAIGLVSSASFEAAYLGASVFMPMTSGDNWYPKEYLDLLYHPEDGSSEALNQSIENWLLSKKPSSLDDRKEVIAQKFKKYGSWGHMPNS